MRHGTGGPPLVFTPRQLHEIVFEVWAGQSGSSSHSYMHAAKFARLFTVMLVCTRPAGMPYTPPPETPGVRRALSLPAAASEPPPAQVVPHVGRAISLPPPMAAAATDSAAGASGAARPAPRRLSIPPLITSDSEAIDLRSDLRSDLRAISEASTGTPSPSIARPSSPLSVPKVPQNPVLLALQLSARCYLYAQQKTRDRQLAERLEHAGTLFEHLGSGMLHCASRAAEQAEEKKQCAPTQPHCLYISNNPCRPSTCRACLCPCTSACAPVPVHHACTSAALANCSMPSPRCSYLGCPSDRHMYCRYNPWRMGTDHIHPDVARDLFVNECLEHAAEHELKIFIAHPIVYVLPVPYCPWPLGPFLTLLTMPSSSHLPW